jgi:LPXTG-site transpeptidase (sortase) family protein
MSQSDIIRFRPVPLGRDANNPEAAEAARQRIAALEDTYAQDVTPPKEELVGAVQPVSPAAEVASSNPGAGVIDAVSSGKLQITRAVAGGSQRVVQSAATVGQAATNVLPRRLSPVEQAAKLPEASNMAPADAAPSTITPARPGLWTRWGKPLVTGIITFALLFVLLKAPIFWNQLSYLTGDKAASTDSAPATTPTTPVAAGSQISIPKINVSAPIVYANSNQEADIQKDLEGGVVHYAHTAVPGEIGNSVIFGHSSNDWWEPGDYKFVFVLLDKLAVGDTFTVTYNSQQYVYKVTETKVVEPTDLSVLNDTPDPELTLITCTPPGTSWKRLVVRAQQISPSPTVAKSSSETRDKLNSIPGSSTGVGEQLGNWWSSFTGLFTTER